MKRTYTQFFLVFLMAYNPVAFATSVAGKGVTGVQGGTASLSNMKAVDICSFHYGHQATINQKRVINPLMHSGVQAGVTSARNKNILFYTGGAVTLVGAAGLAYLAYADQLPFGLAVKEPFHSVSARAPQLAAQAANLNAGHAKIIMDGARSKWNNQLLNWLAPTPSGVKAGLRGATQKVVWGTISTFTLYALGLDTVAKDVKDWVYDVSHPKAVLKKSKKELDNLETYIKELMELEELTSTVFETLVDKINKATKALEASIGFIQYTIGTNSDMVKQAKYNCFYRYIVYGMYPKLNKELALVDGGSVDMNKVHGIVAAIARESDAFFRKMTV